MVIPGHRFDDKKMVAAEVAGVHYVNSVLTFISSISNRLLLIIPLSLFT
jgi:hypothetical protein